MGKIKRPFISGLKKLTELPDNFFKKGTLYVVVAHRWSNTQDHTYLVAAYSTLDSALGAGWKECCERGGKYGVIINATQHTNKFKEDKYLPIYEIESPYKGRAGKKF